MQPEGRARGLARGKARYVFAGTQGEVAQERAAADGTKTCPRCGQVLFDDMDVCYGCLYDFTRDRHGDARDRTAQERALRMSLRKVPAVQDPLEDIELDEIDEEEEKEQSMPRHRRQEAPLETGSPDDTLDLTPRQAAQEVPASQQEYVLLVSSPDMRVRIPLGEEPLTVGRDEANDIVLRDRSVSRRHVRVSRGALGVTVGDLGATNPALLGGVPLEGEVPLRRGEVVEVCGTTLSLA